MLKAKIINDSFYKRTIGKYLHKLQLLPRSIVYSALIALLIIISVPVGIKVNQVLTNQAAPLAVNTTIPANMIRQYEPSLLTNPYLGGELLTFSWSGIQKKELPSGQKFTDKESCGTSNCPRYIDDPNFFDFSKMDNQIQNVISHGKKFSLGFPIPLESGGGFVTNVADACNPNSSHDLPKWEILKLSLMPDSEVGKFNSDADSKNLYCDYDNNSYDVNPFNQTFLNDYKIWVQAMSYHIQNTTFNNTPYVNDLAYVNLGEWGFIHQSCVNFRYTPLQNACDGATTDRNGQKIYITSNGDYYLQNGNKVYITFQKETDRTSSHYGDYYYHDSTGASGPKRYLKYKPGDARISSDQNIYVDLGSNTTYLASYNYSQDSQINQLAQWATLSDPSIDPSLAKTDPKSVLYSKWLVWHKDFLTFQQATFPYTTNIYPIDSQNFVTHNQTEEVNFLKTTSTFAVSTGMGIGQFGLSPSWISEYDPTEVMFLIKYLKNYCSPNIGNTNDPNIAHTADTRCANSSFANQFQNFYIDFQPDAQTNYVNNGQNSCDVSTKAQNNCIAAIKADIKAAKYCKTNGDPHLSSYYDNPMWKPLDTLGSTSPQLENCGVKSIEWYPQDFKLAYFQPQFIDWNSFVNPIQPSVTVTLAPTSTNTPTPTPGNTSIAAHINLALEFISKSGVKGTKINSSPIHTKQDVAIYIYPINMDPSTDPLGQHALYNQTFKQGLIYNSQTGLYSSDNAAGVSDIVLNLPHAIKAGTYQVLFKIPGYLRKGKGVPLLTFTSSTTNLNLTGANPPTLEAGDINGDNKINSADVKIVKNCIAKSLSLSVCPQTANFNDATPLYVGEGDLANFWSLQLSLLLQNFGQIKGQ